MQASATPSLRPAVPPQRMPAAQAGAADALAVDSHQLLRGHKAVEIKHNGAVYRLQTTKLGKLILTK